MTWWYRFWWSCFRVYFRLYHRGRIYHRERLPRTGGIILAPNHVSFLDPPFVGLTCNRAVTYFARDTLFRNPLAKAWLRSWNAVPIKREGGDIGAMRLTLRLLAEGKAVMIFPEGTRSQDGQLQPARSGIGMVAARAKVPVVPVRLFGTAQAMPRGKSLPRPARVTVVFGEPFVPELPAGAEELRGEALKAVYQGIGDEVMRRIAALRPE